MDWNFHILLLIPAFSAVLNASLAWFAWRKRPAPGAASFALVMLAAALWSTGNVLELGSVELSAKIFWVKFEYLGILLLPAAWLAFALQYTGKPLSRRSWALLAIEPIIIWLLLWTNESHGLFIRQFGLRQAAPLLVWENIHGPVHWLNVFYSYCLILSGSFFLLYRLSRPPAPNGKRELVVIAGALLPWFANAVYVLYDFPVPGLDPTPFALTLTGAAFAWGLFSLRLLDFRPPPFVPPNDLPAWRLNLLEGILRGVFILWFLALASGINNVVAAYRAEQAQSHDMLTALGVIAVYVGVTLLIGIITFWRRLPYSLRAGVFLAVLYLLGMIGLALASLSGDGRVFLFAFILLAAVFFDLRMGLGAGALSLVTLVGMGWLQVGGFIVIPAERQINSTDAGAWTSGIIVFMILSAAALISSSSLLRALQTSLEGTRRSLEREQRVGRILRTVGNINQLIVRERDPQRLLRQTCEILVEGHGYSFAWIGLLEADGLTLRLAASAGLEVDAARFTMRLDQQGSAPFCAAQAIRSRAACRISPAASEETCAACPLLKAHPACASVSLPLLREEHIFGALVVEHVAGHDFFDLQELAFLEELADDLAYALENLRAAEQQRALAEVSTALFFARDEDMFWMEVIAAVQRVLRSERVAIYRYDRATERLCCPRFHKLSAEYVNEVARRFHDAPDSAILSDPAPVIVQDVEEDPRTAALREWMRREGFRAYVVFPFHDSKDLSGAFTVYRDAPGSFSASDLAAGGALVRMIGLAFENMELNLETSRKASELAALYAAAQDMALSLFDSHALLQTLARHMTEALHATSVYISTVDAETKTMRIAAEYWSDHAAPAERHSDFGRVYPIEEYPVFYQTLVSGKAASLHDDDPRCSASERAQFAEYGVRTILFVPVMAYGKAAGGIEIWESRRKREFTQAEIRLAQAMAAHAGSVLEISAFYEQTRRHAADLAQAYDSTLAGWARALELRDDLTEGHTRRVTELTLQLARALGLSEDKLIHIRRGALLHDIGKMGIPDSILHKPESLTADEMRLMRRHPQFAYDMLLPIEFLRPALDIPYCHHELWDGSGYPRGLKGGEIPLAARIFTIADNWDALTSNRPYRAAWPKEKARQYIRENAGKLFDPKIVEIFLALVAYHST